MANHKSAEKRNRQRVQRTNRARGVRTRVRAVLKEARDAVSSGADDAATLVLSATRLLDKAASKNVMPFNRVSRLKARLAKALHKKA